MPASARLHDVQMQACIQSCTCELAVVYAFAVSIEAIIHCIRPDRILMESDKMDSSI